jgi:hypothetical protein
VTSAALSAAPRRVRQAELARELQVSRQAIHDLLDRGKLSADAEGLIDLELARMAIAARVHPKGKTAKAVASPAGAGSALPPAERDPMTGAGGAQITNYHVARTLREASEAQMSQLKLAELRGELVRRSEVEKGAAQTGLAIRQQLEPLPDRIAAEFGADDTHRAALRRRIREELDSALRASAAHLLETLDE